MMKSFLQSLFREHLYIVGSLHPYDVLEALERHEERYQDATWRQATPGSPHADTESLYLRMPPEINYDSVFHGKRVVDYPLMAEPAFRNALEDLQHIVMAPIARAMIVRLKPGGHIPWHVDEGEYSEATERYHWCVATNPKCFAHVGDETTNMKANEVWFFDKHAEHCVSNAGDTPRTHLIFDVWVN